MNQIRSDDSSKPGELPPTRPLQPPQKRRWTTLILCSVIFISGGVIGAGLAVLWNTRPWPPPRRTLQERTDRLTKKIADKVDLSAEQTEQLRAIIKERLEEIESIRLEISPKMQAQAQLLDAKITPLLDDRQKTKWKKLYAKLFRRWLNKPPTTQPATQPT